MLHLLNTTIVRRESCTFNICSVHFRAVGKLEYFSSSLVLHLLTALFTEPPSSVLPALGTTSETRFSHPNHLRLQGLNGGMME